MTTSGAFQTGGLNDLPVPRWSQETDFTTSPGMWRYVLRHGGHPRHPSLVLDRYRRPRGAGYRDLWRIAKASIKREVNAAVEAGEKGQNKLKKRVSSLEKDVAVITAENEKLQKGNSDLTVGEEELQAEVAKLDKQVTKLEKRVE